MSEANAQSDGRTDVWMLGETDGRTDLGMGGWMDTTTYKDGLLFLKRALAENKMRLICVLFTFDNNAGRMDLRTDLRTDGRTDGWTDGRTQPLIEM